MEGPFRIEVSETAERLDPALITEEERRALLDGFSFDPSMHDLVRFFVMPVPRQPKGWHSKRQVKDAGFERVDRIYIEVEARAPGMVFRGQFPPSYSVSKGWLLDLEGSVEVKPLEIGRVGLKLQGSNKDRFRRQDQIVVAWRHDRSAQWAMKREWLALAGDLRFQLTCIAPKSLQADHRALYCTAKFAERDRSLARVRDRRVALP